MTQTTKSLVFAAAGRVLAGGMFLSGLSLAFTEAGLLGFALMGLAGVVNGIAQDYEQEAEEEEALI